jgi:hypothetical protein
MALVNSLKASENDVIRALKNWEPQQLQLGLHLKQRGQAIGHQSQFLFGQGRHLRTACYER